MLRQSLTAVALLGIGLLRDPGCGGVDEPNGGPNAPCTRGSDCGHGLSCTEGVCREPAPTPDAGAAERDSSTLLLGDAGNDGG